MPATVGVPLTVIVLPFNEAVTPAGRPDGDPIPVAPVIAIVMGVNVVLIQSVGLDEGGATVFAAVTLIVPVALTVPHPPNKGIL